MIFLRELKFLHNKESSWYSGKKFSSELQAPKNKWTPHKLPNSWSKPPLPVAKQWGKGNALYNILFITLKKKTNRSLRFWNDLHNRLGQMIWWGGEHENTS